MVLGLPVLGRVVPVSANWKAWTRQLLQMVKSRRVGAEEIVASRLPASLLLITEPDLLQAQSSCPIPELPCSLGSPAQSLGIVSLKQARTEVAMSANESPQ